MKVKDIVNKVRLIDTEVILREGSKVVSTFKTPVKECEYLERTVLTFQPLEKNKLEIYMKYDVTL